MYGISLGFPGLWDGMMDSGIRALHSGTLGTCPGCPWASWDSEMGWTVGLEPSTIGRSGRIRDVPGLHGTLGWDGHGDCSHLEWDDPGMYLGFLGLLEDWSLLEWDAWDMSGMSLGFPGLWDGMDSGIGAVHSGTLGTCPRCPWAS